MTATAGARSTSTGAPQDAHGARSAALDDGASRDDGSMRGALERIPDAGVKPRRPPVVASPSMQASGDPVEIVYERPAPPARRGLIVAGAALFAGSVLWVTARSLPGLGWIAVAAAITLAVLAVQSRFGGAAVLATRRVTLDPGARSLRVEHRRGALSIALADVAEVTHGKVTEGDGVTLDAVTLTLRGGAAQSFGVASPEAAEGAARAIRAAMEEGGEAGEAAADQSA
jgi:hypothetical protein